MAILIAVRFGLKAKTISIPVYFVPISSILPPINIPLISVMDIIPVTWRFYAFFMIFAYSSDILSPETYDVFRQFGQFLLKMSLVSIVLFAITIVLTNFISRTLLEY